MIIYECDGCSSKHSGGQLPEGWIIWESLAAKIYGILTCSSKCVARAKAKFGYLIAN